MTCLETSITKHQSYKQTDIDVKYIIDIICANYVQSKTFLDVLSWKLDRMYSVLWGTKRWKIIYNKRKYSKFYNCGGAKWPKKEAKPTFWCFEKTGPPSQKYNSWRWGQNTAQLQLPPPLPPPRSLRKPGADPFQDNVWSGIYFVNLCEIANPLDCRSIL